MQWKVVLPIKVLVGKKYFYLNLNQYRNTHYQILNKAKTVFAELVSPLLKDIPHLNKCSFKYIYYAPSKRETDISNICSVVDKFFSDVFVSAGKLIDDNYKYLDEVTYAFGGIDPNNPRVEVVITLKESNMKLVITQEDLQQAVASHLAANGFNIDAESISVDLDEIEIDLSPASSETKETKPKRTRRTKAEIEAEKVDTQSAEASIAIDTSPASTRTEETSEEDDEPEEDVIGSIIDEIAPATVSDKPKEPTSIFG